MDEISGCVLVPEVISTCKCVRAVWMRLVGVSTCKCGCEGLTYSQTSLIRAAWD